MYGLWYHLVLTALLSSPSWCNPGQVVLSIQSVSAALSSLQAWVNHQPLSLSLLLPRHKSIPATSLLFSLSFFFVLVSSSTLLWFHLHLKPILPCSSSIFWWATRIFLPLLHINTFFSVSRLSSLRLLRFLLYNLIFSSFTFVCDFLWPHSPFILFKSHLSPSPHNI